MPRQPTAALLLMGSWVAVETLTLWAAGFGGGPFVPLVANEHGEADGHTRRFAAFLASLMLLNVYAIATALGASGATGTEAARRATVLTTTLVADEIAMAAALVVEVSNGAALAVAWHAALLACFGLALLGRGVHAARE